MTNDVVACPGCGKPAPLPADARGKQVRCPACQAVFQVAVRPPPVPPTVPRAPAVPPAPGSGPATGSLRAGPAMALGAGLVLAFLALLWLGGLVRLGRQEPSPE